MNNRLTIFRVVLFCLLCAVVLAITSGLFKNVPSEWNQHLMLVVAIIITYALTLLFTKWEKIPLKNVGVVAGKSTLKKVLIGFAIGLIMTALQPVFVLLLGHYKMVQSYPFSPRPIFFYLTLYILVAIREELAFRGYPLFSLNYKLGLWASQLIIFVIFSLEHVVGGMTWVQAFAGAGTGALLFGFAALRTNGIALPIGLHAAWNFGQWCWGFKNERGILQGVADKGFEEVVNRNAWISYLLIMIIFIAIFYFYTPRKNRATI